MDLKENIGEYIQMEGFISTSLSSSVGKTFAFNSGNSIIEIKVSDDALNNPFHEGFADLSDFSDYGEGEREILFNALNYFRIA